MSEAESAASDASGLDGPAFGSYKPAWDYDPVLVSAKETPMRFRKKPVVIDAHQWTPGGWDALMGWLLALGLPGEDSDQGPAMWVNGDGTLTIDTLEGEMTASLGDWIIRGVGGEFYPCKPDIFEATYEPAAAQAEASQAGESRD